MDSICLKLMKKKSSVSNKLVVQDLILTNPCCCLGSKLNLYKKFSISLLMIPSMVLREISMVLLQVAFVDSIRY